MIDNIVIVGGGTSGWLSVCNLLFRIHESKNINITVIESPDVPIIGVGESTTGKMHDIINKERPTEPTGPTAPVPKRPRK